MGKLQLPEWTFPNTAYKNAKTQFYGSSLPGVAEFPYMEGFIFICSWKDCMELALFFSL